MPTRPKSSAGQILALLADDDVRRVVQRIIDRPATQRELRDELRLQSSALSRQMQALEAAGLVVHDRGHGPYEVVFSEQTRELIRAALNLARDISAARSAVDAEEAREFQKRGMVAVSRASERRGAS